MTIKRTESGKWLADISVGGRRGERIRKIFRTQREAQSFESSVRGNHAQGKPWDFAFRQQDYRLTELCDVWHQIHGQNLKDGSARVQTLNKVCKELEDSYTTFKLTLKGLGFKKRFSTHAFT